MTTIEIRDIEKSFRKVKILDGVDCEFTSGNIYGIVGHNGSGKTVLLKLLAGLIYPTKGTIIVNGNSLRKGEILHSLGVIIEKPSFFNSLSGIENLRLLADLQKIISDKEIMEVLHKVGLYENKDKKVRKYSLGMKQRLAFAQAVMENPKHLLLDEPTSALDPISSAKIEELMYDLKNNYTIVIVTHNIQQAARISDTTAFFYMGELIEYGKTKKVFTSPKNERTQNYITGRFG